MEETKDDRDLIREDMVIEDTLERELERLATEAKRLEAERRRRQRLLEGGTEGGPPPPEESEESGGGL
jgi:hypothetical protein